MSSGWNQRNFPPLFLFMFEERFLRNFPAYLFLLLICLNSIFYPDLNQFPGNWGETKMYGSDGYNCPLCYRGVWTHLKDGPCLTLCDPIDCSTPGFPVLHYHPEFAQTHVHWVNDAIQPSHPLSFPFSSPQSSPASGCYPVSQLFATGGQNIEASASVLPMNIQDWFPLGLTSLISLLSKGLSRVFFSTTIQKYQLISAQLSLWPNSHIHTHCWKNHSFD